MGDSGSLPEVLSIFLGAKHLLQQRALVLPRGGGRRTTTSPRSSPCTPGLPPPLSSRPPFGLTRLHMTPGRAGEMAGGKWTMDARGGTGGRTLRPTEKRGGHSAPMWTGVNRARLGMTLEHCGLSVILALHSRSDSGMAGGNGGVQVDDARAWGDGRAGREAGPPNHHDDKVDSDQYGRAWGDGSGREYASWTHSAPH